MRQSRPDTQQQASSRTFNQPKCNNSGLPQLAIDQYQLGAASDQDEMEDPLSEDLFEAPLALYRQAKAAYDLWTETEHKCHQELLKIIAQMPESEAKPLKDSLEASERAWMNLYGKESTLLRKIYEKHASERAKAAQMYDLMKLMKSRALNLQRRIELLKS